jgi:hypothetical protein
VVRILMICACLSNTNYENFIKPLISNPFDSITRQVDQKAVDYYGCGVLIRAIPSALDFARALNWVTLPTFFTPT